MPGPPYPSRLPTGLGWRPASGRLKPCWRPAVLPCLVITGYWNTIHRTPALQNGRRTPCGSLRHLRRTPGGSADPEAGQLPFRFLPFGIQLGCLEIVGIRFAQLAEFFMGNGAVEMGAGKVGCAEFDATIEGGQA